MLKEKSLDFQQLVGFQHCYEKVKGRGWIPKDCGAKVGIIVGIRTIGVEGHFEDDSEYSEGYLIAHSHYYCIDKSETVYLVATNMKQIFRVRKEDITLLNQEVKK